MNKHKGFTLVELLAVIVILGILLSISVVAVGKIKKNQDEENYKNVLSSILTGAKEYCTDRNISTEEVDVKTLLENNYTNFDEKKYSELKDEKVTIAICHDNNNKTKYSIKDYNDCGCEEQEASTEKVGNLCIGN